MRSRITKRDFLRLLGAVSALSVDAASKAQESIRRIGFLTPFPAGFPFEQGFGDRLRELGYEQGRSIAIEWTFSKTLRRPTLGGKRPRSLQARYYRDEDDTCGPGGRGGDEHHTNCIHGRG